MLYSFFSSLLVVLFYSSILSAPSRKLIHTYALLLSNCIEIQSHDKCCSALACTVFTSQRMK